MDGFFRETKEKVAYRKSEGCSVVEREGSALAAWCRLPQRHLGDASLYSGQPCRRPALRPAAPGAAAPMNTSSPCVSTPFWPSDPKFSPSANAKEALS